MLQPHPAILTLLAPPVTIDHHASIRERLMRAIGQRLKRITLANAFQTNVGSHLFYGALVTPEPEVLPATYFWDGNETAAGKEYGTQLKALTVVVETYDKLPDPHEVTVPDFMTVMAGRMLADVERAIWTNPTTERSDPSFDGLAERFEYVSSQTVNGLEPELWIGSLSQWQVTYATRLGDPFSQ